MMTKFDYETRFLAAAAGELESYLLSNELYWNLGLRVPRGAPPYPRFSLGWLLLFQQRVRAAAPDAELAGVLAAIARTETRWRNAWQRKAGLEFGQRLNLWADYLSDLRKSPDTQRDRYPYEVQRRTMLALLGAEADDLPAAQVELLRATDAFLRAAIQPGPFVDQPHYQPAFPPDEYWYLYGSPAAGSSQ